jgi:hypothetical protein
MVKLLPGGPEWDSSVVVATGVADVRTIAIVEMIVNWNMLDRVSNV